MIQSCTVRRYVASSTSSRKLQPLGRQIAAIALPARLALGDRRALAAGMLILDGPHVDLAQPGRDRPHLRLGTRRQAFFGLAEPFATCARAK